MLLGTKVRSGMVTAIANPPVPASHSEAARRTLT
jgi:hypothetical protein